MASLRNPEGCGGRYRGVGVCVRCKGQEGIMRPPFIEGVVVLYGPPAEGLKTGVDLEDVRLVQVFS